MKNSLNLQIIPIGRTFYGQSNKFTLKLNKLLNPYYIKEDFNTNRKIKGMSNVNKVLHTNIRSGQNKYLSAKQQRNHMTEHEKNVAYWEVIRFMQRKNTCYQF